MPLSLLWVVVTMSDEYTPTTEVVRDEWVHLEGFIIPDGVPKREAAFDRWLAAHDREVAAKALTDVADDLESRGYESFDRLTVGNVLSKLRARAAALGVPEEAEHG